MYYLVVSNKLKLICFLFTTKGVTRCLGEDDLISLSFGIQKKNERGEKCIEKRKECLVLFHFMDV